MAKPLKEDLIRGHGQAVLCLNAWRRSAPESPQFTLYAVRGSRPHFIMAWNCG